MSTMRQWWTVPGESEGVPELREVPIPEPRPGEVLVKIAGAGVNRGELIGRRALRLDNPAARPGKSGIEFAGSIAAVGDAVAGWSVGDRVMGRGRACHAEYTVSPVGELMATPAGLGDDEAAAIPNVFVTAHDAIVTAARTAPGDRVMVTAGSSGVGTAALQIAACLGAAEVVATTRSMAKREALLSLGATAVVDSTQADWSRSLVQDSGPIDVVIDQVGGGLFPDLLATMGVGGRFVTVGRNDSATSTIDLDLVAKQRLEIIGVTFRTRTPDEALACSQHFVDDLLARFDTGELKPVLDRAFPLEDLPRAHAYMSADGQIGKIIVQP
ncbi:MAG: zinc-binding dehydrogenase [Actinomycetota bacterium]|nr:zinc-binding dehydrogenase [Actinomycetota bacterium]